MPPPNEPFTEDIALAVEFAKIFQFSGVVDLFENLWGDVGRLESAAQVWDYLAAEVLDKTVKNGLSNEVKRRFRDDDWSGDAKDAYLDWLSDFKEQAVIPLASRAREVSKVLTGVASQVRDIRHNLQLLAVAFLVAAGVEAYRNKTGPGGHARPPGQGGGAHVRPRGNGGLQLGLILLALAALAHQLWDYYGTCTKEMKEFQVTLEKLRTAYPVGDIRSIMPVYPAAVVADPRNWRDEK